MLDGSSAVLDAKEISALHSMAIGADVVEESTSSTTGNFSVAVGPAFSGSRFGTKVTSVLYSDLCSPRS